MLQNLVNEGGQCVNLGRSMKVRHPELHTWVLESTPWIPESAKFNERVYCILNNITEPVMDAHGTPAKFSDINTGYLMREASAQGAISKKEKEIIKEAKRKERESKPVLSDFEKAIAKVLRRTKNRNPQFYAPDAVEGVDYVVCPVSQARFRHIRADHITNVLGMTLDEFNAKFPETKMVAQGRIEAIKRGLSVITDNGLTVHQNAHQKAVETLQSVGADGMRGYDKLGAKTRATHLGQVDENGLNGYQRIAKDAIPKGNQTKADKGMIIDPAERSRFYMYKNVVMYVTSIYKDDIRKGYVTGLCGTDGAYQIDHKYSITHGYQNGVSPLLIGGKHNLEMITWEENISKYTKSSIELDKLFEISGYTSESSREEFDTVMKIVDDCRARNIHMSALQIIELMAKKYNQL